MSQISPHGNLKFHHMSHMWTLWQIWGMHLRKSHHEPKDQKQVHELAQGCHLAKLMDTDPGGSAFNLQKLTWSNNVQHTECIKSRPVCTLLEEVSFWRIGWHTKWWNSNTFGMAQNTCKFIILIFYLQAYMIFVADAADIVRGAHIFMWSNFDKHENLCMLCGGKVLNMKSNLAPHEIFFLSWKQSNGLTQNPCCRFVHCFDAKLILLRFSHFCVEQKSVLSVEQKWQISCMSARWAYC